MTDHPWSFEVVEEHADCVIGRATVCRGGRRQCFYIVTSHAWRDKILASVKRSDGEWSFWIGHDLETLEQAHARVAQIREKEGGRAGKDHAGAWGLECWRLQRDWRDRGVKRWWRSEELTRERGYVTVWAERADGWVIGLERRPCGMTVCSQVRVPQAFLSGPMEYAEPLNDVLSAFELGAAACAAMGWNAQ